MEKVNRPMIRREIPETGITNARIAAVTRAMAEARINEVSLELYNIDLNFKFISYPFDSSDITLPDFFPDFPDMDINRPGEHINI